MAGRLIYLIGPSGSGKDSLLDAARARLAERGCRIVRRVITRSAEAVGEAALGVSAQQFAEMEAQGAFALSWHANGLAYGIPREIDDWLAAGQDVLVNGSRGHLRNARRTLSGHVGGVVDRGPGRVVRAFAGARTGVRGANRCTAGTQYPFQQTRPC